MKKFFVLLSFVITSQTSVFSQLEIGGEIAPSFSNMNIGGDYNLINNVSHITGAKTGITLKYYSPLGLGVETGLQYHLTGFKVKQGLDFEVYNLPVSAGVTAIPRFHFLEVPALLSYRTGGNKIHGIFSAGPYVAFAVDGEIKTRANFLIDFNLGTYDLNLNNNIFNRWEIGLMAKAGFEIPIQDFKLSFFGSFQHGLNDLSDVPILDIRTRRYALGLGTGLAYVF